MNIFRNKNFRDKLVILLVLNLTVFAFYSNSLRNKFVFSDHYLIVNNYLLRSLKSIPYYFRGYISQNVKNVYYRPFTMLSYNINFLFHDYHIFGYRIFNLILHCFNAFLLYNLLLVLFGSINKKVNLFIALIFLIHPINNETVNYLTVRSDLLVTFFLLSSFYYFLKWFHTSRIKFKIFSLLLYFCALLSKEVALIYPFLLLGFVFLNQRGNIKRNFSLLKPFFVIFFIFALFFILNISHPVKFRPLSYNFLIQLKALFLYLRLFIFPYGFSFDHQYFLHFSLMIYSFILILGVLFFLKLRKESKFAIYWLLSLYSWKFFIQLRMPAMEHHFYLPGIGIFIFLVPIIEKFLKDYPRITLLICLLLFLILGGITYFRNFVWYDETKLSQEILSKYPESKIANYQMGLKFKEEKKISQAIRYFKKSLTSHPDSELEIKTLANIAESYLSIGEIEKALNWTRFILKKYPFTPVGYRLSERIFLQASLPDLEEFLNTCPKNEYFFYSLSDYNYRKGNIRKAETYLTSALKLGFDSPQIYYLYGEIRNNQGDVESAISYYRKALKEDPLYKEVYFALGTLLVKEFNSEGVYYLKKVIQLDPFFPPGYYNLGLYYLSKGNKKLASVYLAKAKNLGYFINSKIWDLLGQLP